MEGDLKMSDRKLGSALIGIYGLDAIFLRGVQSILGPAEYVKQTYVSSVQTEMIDLASRLRPDIVVLKGWEEPNDFVYVGQRIKEVNPDGRTLVFLTDRKDQEALLSACEARADAILDAQSDLANVEKALKALMRGESYISNAVARYILSLVVDLLTFARRPRPVMGAERLTKRETEVLELMRRGCKNHEIASHLSISVNTVHNHVVRISRKLRLRDKREVVDFHPTDAEEPIEPAVRNFGISYGQSVLNRYLERMNIPSGVWTDDDRYRYNPNRVQDTEE